MEDNVIRTISVQSKALKGHEEKLKEAFNFSLREANDEKLTH